MAGGSVAFLRPAESRPEHAVAHEPESRRLGESIRRVLHLASFHEWTGAPAVAFAEVEALRRAGVDARFAYVGGGLLEKRVGRHPFTYGFIDHKQNPWTIFRSGTAIRRFVRQEAIDLIHAHLTFDHWLARFAAHGATPVVRTFHARRTLRDDIATRDLLRATSGIAVVNETFLQAPLLSGRKVAFTPPPVDREQFNLEGPDARASLGIGRDTPVFGVIGKIAPGRGFEKALHAFATIRARIPSSKLLVMGEGSHQSHLEWLTGELGLQDSVIWAGYHEDDLPDYYRAMDLMLFTAPGSEEGHRAVSEAMACGVPVVSRPIDGVSTILGDLASELIAPDGDPKSQGALAAELHRSGRAASLREACSAATVDLAFAPAAGRLMKLYQEAVSP